MLKFLRSWTLPVAMLTGAIIYFIFAYVPSLEPVKPIFNTLTAYLIPFLIFSQLLFTFSKMTWKELLPSPWHGWLVLFQFVSCLFLAGLLVFLPLKEEYRIVLEGAMVCLICPTATAAAVITGKLGGSASSLTTYTLFSNLLAAVLVSLLFPLVEPHAGQDFIDTFLLILGKVLPLLISPILIAFFLRTYFPTIHLFLQKLSYMAFYLWALALAIVTGQTIRSLANSNAEIGIELWLAFMGLLTCAIQFYLGKRIGTKYNDRISAGQALGQKNTVLAIWMAYTYLHPLASVAPGCYVLWQNMFNSWQLWKKRKVESNYNHIKYR